MIGVPWLGTRVPSRLTREDRTGETTRVGHLLTPQGIMVDPRKVAAIQVWPTPLNVSQLRGFLGLTQYYDTFMDYFADVAYPLTKLLEKDVPWTWEGLQIQAFVALKDLVSSPPCLLMPDLEKPWGPWQVAAPTCYAFKMITYYFYTYYTALFSRFPWYCHGWTRMAMLMDIPCPHVMPHNYGSKTGGPAHFASQLCFNIV
eukprot:jgi/Botrbrau1/16548/Bobra.0256s0007.1